MLTLFTTVNIRPKQFKHCTSWWNTRWWRVLNYRDTLRWAVQNAWTDRDAVWVVGLDAPKEYVLDGVQLTLWEVAFLWKGACLQRAVQKRLNRDVFWDAESVDPLEIRRGSRSLMHRGNFGERTYPGMSDDTLSWAVQKWLNQSKCRLVYGLGWAVGPRKHVHGKPIMGSRCPMRSSNFSRNSTLWHARRTL